MLNIGGWEVLIIFLVALVVLGPERLPDAAKQVGKVFGDLKRMSSGFQREFNEAMKDPVTKAGLNVTMDAEVPQDPFAAKKTSMSAASSESPADDPMPENEGPRDVPVAEDEAADPDPPMPSDR